jgi:hypothetical protein
VLSVVFALAAFSVAGCASTSEEPQVEAGTGETSGDTGGGGGEADAKVGDTLTLEGTAYRVTKVSTARTLGDQFTKTKADGKFVVVNLTLTNKKDEPATIIEDAVRLVGGNGKEYTVDTDAAFTFDNSLLVLTDIQPDLSKKVVAVYDVSPKAVKGAVLQVKDLFSDSKGTIDLGL